MSPSLPFQLERCTAPGAEKSLIPHMAGGVSNPPFTPGIEVTHWNGVPIAQAVEVSGDRFAGSNRAARLARGVDALTLRPLRLHLPPDEEWVTITYLDAGGVRHELRQPWLVGPNVPPLADADAPSPAAASIGLDLFADEVGRARARLFAPQAVAQQLSDVEAEVETEPAAA